MALSGRLGCALIPVASLLDGLQKTVSSETNRNLYCSLGSSSVNRRRLSGRLETPDKQQQRDCGQCQPGNDTEAIHERQQTHRKLQHLVEVTLRGPAGGGTGEALRQ